MWLIGTCSAIKLSNVYFPWSKAQHEKLFLPPTALVAERWCFHRRLLVILSIWRGGGGGGISYPTYLLGWRAVGISAVGIPVGKNYPFQILTPSPTSTDTQWLPPKQVWFASGLDASYYNTFLFIYTSRKLLVAGVRDEAVPAPARVQGHQARRRGPVSRGKTRSGSKWRQLHRRVKRLGKGVFTLKETKADAEIDKNGLYKVA